MKIPSEALIPAGKLAQYLLVRKPRNDKSRYLVRAGFTTNNPDTLQAAIRKLASEADAIIDRANEFGTYYTNRGSLVGPTGRTIHVRLVWLLRVDGIFTFVTLVPEKEIS